MNDNNPGRYGGNLAETFCPECNDALDDSAYSAHSEKTLVGRMPRFVRRLLPFFAHTNLLPRDNAVNWYDDMQRGVFSRTSTARSVNFRQCHTLWHEATAPDSAARAWLEALRNGRNLKDRQPEIIALAGGLSDLSARIRVALLADSFTEEERAQLERSLVHLSALASGRERNNWNALFMFFHVVQILLIISALLYTSGHLQPLT